MQKLKIPTIAKTTFKNKSKFGEKKSYINSAKVIFSLHNSNNIIVVVVQLLSHVQSSLCNPMDYRMPGSPALHYFLKLAQIHVHWVDDAIQPSHPRLPSSPFAFILSQHQGLSNEWIFHIKWQKCWNLKVSINLSSEYSGLISFRTDWLDLTVQETLESLLQHPNSKASIFQCSACFMVLSHLYMTARKTIALTMWTFVDKMMSLPFFF